MGNDDADSATSDDAPETAAAMIGLDDLLAIEKQIDEERLAVDGGDPGPGDDDDDQGDSSPMPEKRKKKRKLGKKRRKERQPGGRERKRHRALSDDDDEIEDQDVDEPAEALSDGFVVPDDEEAEEGYHGPRFVPSRTPSSGGEADCDRAPAASAGDRRRWASLRASRSGAGRPAGRTPPEAVGGEEGEGSMAGGDEDEGAGGAMDELRSIMQDSAAGGEEAELYRHPKNANNMGKALLVTDQNLETTANDGYMYCFFSPTDSPALSTMAKKQINLLLHVINYPMTRAHVVETPNLKPTFNKDSGVLETLTCIEKLPEGNLYESRGITEEDMKERVDEIPFEKVCDFRKDACTSDEVHNPVNVADIFVSPVPATYRYTDANGQEAVGRRTFWLVVLKTKLCYDFAGHLCSILRGDDELVSRMRKTGAGGGGGGGYGVHQHHQWLCDLALEVLLYSYKLCPNVNAYLDLVTGGSVRVSPLDRAFHEIASPDSIEAVCNIYAVYRSMLHFIHDSVPKESEGPGGALSWRRVWGVDIDGFSAGLQATNGGPDNDCGYALSMETQAEWRESFIREQKRIERFASDLKKVNGIKDPEEKRKALEELQMEDLGTVCHLPTTVGWPRVRTTDEGGAPDIVDQGLPQFSLVMLVDIIDRFTFPRNMGDFQTMFGNLPARVEVEVTNMIYSPPPAASGGPGDEGTAVPGSALPYSVFLPEPKFLSAHGRWERYKNESGSMESFYSAGCLSAQRQSIMQVIERDPDPVNKLDKYNEYMERVQHQFKSLALNGSLHSVHTTCASESIEKGNHTACGDLRKLLRHSFAHLGTGDAAGDPVMGDWDLTQGDMEEKAFSDDPQHGLYWDMMCSSTFMRDMWYLEELNKLHNKKFFLSTPQNQRLCQDIELSSLMYRLGQHNNFTYMGMPTTVCDGAAKLKVRIGFNETIVDQNKRPTAGFDYCLQKIDVRRTSHYAYFNGDVPKKEDRSKISKMKRATPAALNAGCLTWVNDRIEQGPGDLAHCVAASEGLQNPNQRETLNQAVIAIPRDGDHEIELWTTVDKDKSNIRSKGVSKLIRGFSIYLVAFAKNQPYEQASEQRYRDLLIVCNILPANFTIDKDGLYHRKDGSKDAFESAEMQVDENLVRRGVMQDRNTANSMKEGGVPTDADQRLWAPLHYFAYWVAGVSIAMSNKMGSWNMMVDYSFKCVSEYLRDFQLSTLKCFMSEDDLFNQPRYYKSYMCRCVADTVLKTSFMCMRVSDTIDAAVHDATRVLSCNAVDVAMLPSLHERFLTRMIQYEPLLGMVVLGLALEVPVVSLESMLQFLDGKQIRDQDDFDLLKRFCERCKEKHMFLSLSTVRDGIPGSHRGDLSPYITSGGPWDSSSSSLREKISVMPGGGGSGGSGYRGQGGQGGSSGGDADGGDGGGGGGGGKNGLSNEILNAICKKIYAENRKVLNSCAGCKKHGSFFHALVSLQKAYDLRDFFGGMSKYHDTRSLLRSLRVQGCEKFPPNFTHASSAQPAQQQQQQAAAGAEADPVMFVGNLASDVHCVSVRIWDVLLWFAILQRPRRDAGIMVEFSHRLVEYSMRLLPRSVFPYDIVPMGRLDHITGDQAFCDLSTGPYVGRDLSSLRTHPTIIRRKNTNIFSKNKGVLECPGKGRSGVLEDEMFMSSYFMLAEELSCDWHEIPIDRWPLRFAVQFGESYPVVRYPNANKFWSSSSRGARQQRHGSLSSPEFLKAAHDIRHHKTGVVFMNPSRRSAMLCTLGDESQSHFAARTAQALDEEDWAPDVFKVQEFTLARITGPGVTQCADVNEIQQRLAMMGFGPCPYYRRPGVLVHCSPQGGDAERKQIGCVVPHSAAHLHCCVNCEFRTCYICVHNPFYEVSFGGADLAAGAGGDDEDTLGSGRWSKTVRMTPMRVQETVIPVGTMMYLSTESRDLQDLLQASKAKLLHSAGKRSSRRNVRYDDEGNPSVVVAAGHPSALPDAADGSQEGRTQPPRGGRRAPQQQGEEREDLESSIRYVQVFLDVSKNFAPVHGKAYVSLKVSHMSSRMTMDVRSLYVSPSDLRMPSDLVLHDEDEGGDAAALDGTVVTHLVLR